jgi:uridine phosphorylase
MPPRLRPTAPIAADAILVGDPGRALLLAQELLEQPKMSNHARGLWGYSGASADGMQLTIQATGIGGPSAALVLSELAELGVRRAIRVGSCVAVAGRAKPGDLILVERAVATSGSSATFGLAPGEHSAPDRSLHEDLRAAIGRQGAAAAIASLDTFGQADRGPLEGIAATDMQTVAVLARASELGVAAAAVLVVSAVAGSETLGDAEREAVERRAGRAAASALSPSS